MRVFFVLTKPRVVGTLGWVFVHSGGSMPVQFVGADPHMIESPQTSLVRNIQVIECREYVDGVTLAAIMPGKRAINTARATYAAGISPHKEWVGRLLALGLSVLCRNENTIRINLVNDLHFRTTSNAWDGRAFEYVQDVPVLLDVTRGRTTRKVGYDWCTAEWHLYRQSISTSTKLLHGGCGYQLQWSE